MEKHAGFGVSIGRLEARSSILSDSAHCILHEIGKTAVNPAVFRDAATIRNLTNQNGGVVEGEKHAGFGVWYTRAVKKNGRRNLSFPRPQSHKLSRGIMPYATSKSKSRSNSIPAPDSGKAVANGNAVNGTAPPSDTGNAAPPVAPSQLAQETVVGDDRPVILLSTEEKQNNDETIKALARAKGLYQYQGSLVKIMSDDSPAAEGIRSRFAPRIVKMSPAELREILTTVAVFKTKRTSKNGTVNVEYEASARPPAWCTSAVFNRGDWPGLPHLEGVVDNPVILKDGSILERHGYDKETGLIQAYSGPSLQVPDRPTQENAKYALQSLLSAVDDFPFASDAHRYAWAAALLTVLTRYAFNGPAPLFLAESNVRGAGKGKLFNCIGRITTGRDFPVTVRPKTEDELKKLVTSLLASGDTMVLFDNLDGDFGSGNLDAALTGTTWKDRELGASSMIEKHMALTWFATGNNVEIKADTARRVCPIRLHSPLEKPEDRKDFKHPNLLEWIDSKRTCFLRDAFIVLRAFILDGLPEQSLEPWGSYEGWSGLVRKAIVFAGGVDPIAANRELKAYSDPVPKHMDVLLRSWEKIDGQEHGMTSKELIRRANGDSFAEAKSHFVDFKGALDELLTKVEPKKLGELCKKYKGRNFNGRMIVPAGSAGHLSKWAVKPADGYDGPPTETHQTRQTHFDESPFV